MSRKQLLLLFFCGLIIFTIANGLMPLLPIYAVQLGASQTLSGYYLAFACLAVTFGALFAGWLSDKFQRRKLLLIVSGAIAIPFIWMMGEVKNVWQLGASTVAVWFLLGLAWTIITILAGLFAAKKERGRVIGIIGMTMGLGSIVGGLSVGPMVDRWGYPTLFLVLCIFSIALPTIALFLKDKKIEQTPKPTAQKHATKPSFSKAFFILLLAQLITVTLNSIGPMGRSLAMDNLSFTATAITSTVAISGLVSLPFPFILGWLSDRLGRKSMMVICYASYALSVVMLAISTSLWHFWIVMILSKVGMVSMSVGASFATDLVDPKALGRGVSLFQSAGWTAMTIGYVFAGNAFQAFGISATSFISTALPVIGIILIMLIRVRKQEEVIT